VGSTDSVTSRSEELLDFSARSTGSTNTLIGEEAASSTLMDGSAELLEEELLEVFIEGSSNTLEDEDDLLFDFSTG